VVGATGFEPPALPCQQTAGNRCAQGSRGTRSVLRPRQPRPAWPSLSSISASQRWGRRAPRWPHPLGSGALPRRCAEDSRRPWSPLNSYKTAKVEQHGHPHISAHRPPHRHNVGSSRGAVLAFQPVRFLGPPSEPAVRVTTQRALHKPSRATSDPAHVLGHGEGSLLPGSDSGWSAPRRD
jgi:hypothetical protein